MKLQFAVGILFLFCVGAICAFAADPATRPANAFVDLDAAAFEKMAQQSGTVVLDVRTAAEFAEGHIKGAINIDVQAADFARRIAELDKNKTYLVQCRSGKRSVAACTQMSGLEFSKLYNLVGGILAWQEAGKPFEKSP